MFLQNLHTLTARNRIFFLRFSLPIDSLFEYAPRGYTRYTTQKNSEGVLRKIFDSTPSPVY
ncbi:hypothetical protein PORCAN_560 [Porphyromonas crevioricanis JCM 13913]|nr:hypothetical protein PORCAN_560 [Porphyromonas crevioricanis JCM 13913]